MSFDLTRFTKAQQNDYANALSEIEDGRKRSHWMWYIFPQVQGLGFSEASRYYGIKNLAEAEAYLNDPVLGSRLLEISNALLKLETNDAHAVFGSPDDLKLRSCMTLFAALPNTNTIFKQVLDKFFKGEQDKRTLQQLGKS